MGAREHRDTTASPSLPSFRRHPSCNLYSTWLQISSLHRGGVLPTPLNTLSSLPPPSVHTLISISNTVSAMLTTEGPWLERWPSSHVTSITKSCLLPNKNAAGTDDGVKCGNEVRTTGKGERCAVI